MKHFFCQLFVVGSMLLLVASSASAATFTVTNVNGTGAGSLRQAVTDSNNSAGADTINFNLPAGPQTIMLLGGEILITDAVTINGPGSNLLTVNGNAVSRVFHIARNQIFVTISGLTVTNGMNTGIGFEGWGGGIYNEAGLSLTDVVVSGNSSPSGGGIGSLGTLTLVNSVVRNNTADGGGGIIGLEGSLTILSSTISGNVSRSGGGGISSFGGLRNISNSTIIGNTANGDGGGVLFVTGGGFGISTFTNCTVSGNVANRGGGFAGVTQPVQMQTINVDFNNNTFSDNSASIGGGLFFSHQVADGTLSQVTIRQSIFRKGPNGANIYRDNVFTQIGSSGYSISDDDGGGFLTATGDRINTDPLLGPLQNNGGLTLTRCPLPGSPAIDGGNPSFSGPPSIDQRGMIRVVDGDGNGVARVDAGAVEVSPGIASRITISGRVLQAIGGRGITNARVQLVTGSGTLQVITGRRGNFSFSNVLTGQQYTLGVASRRFAFTPQNITPSSNIANIVLTPN